MGNSWTGSDQFWKNKCILIVEDEPEMRELLSTIFERAGAQVRAVADGEDGLHCFFQDRPDLIILDILLPGMDGHEVLQTVRRLSDVPVIIVSAVTSQQSRLAGLDGGADDYITKPFEVKELLARCRVAIRRAGPKPAANLDVAFDDGHLCIDLEARKVRREGRTVRLTPTEYRLLAYLVRHLEQVCTFEQILNAVWGPEFVGTADNIHVYIYQLRQKIEPDPRNPRYLINEHSIGYRFVRAE